jgi:hypothetical protein
VRAVALIACAACNQVLGVHKTRLSDALSDDIDGDGIPNEHDNCPTVYNPGQEDRDNDGVGDACDLCPDTPDPTNHDEDRDGVGDVCDDCPLTPDFQVDSDGDGIGDACDIAFYNLSKRVNFDAFQRVGPPWQASGVAWQSDGDEVAPVTALPMDDNGLVAPTIQIAGSLYWSVELLIVSRQPWGGTDEIGLVVLDQASQGEVAECVIQCAGSCMLQAQGPGFAPYTIPIAPAPIVHLFMRWYPGETSYSMECDTDVVQVGTLIVPSPLPDWTPSLRATPTATIGAIDILTSN